MYIVYSIHAVILTYSLAKNGLENGSTVAVVLAASVEKQQLLIHLFTCLPDYL